MSFCVLSWYRLERRKKPIKCECKAMTWTKFVCFMICDPIQGFKEQNFMGFQLYDLSFEFFKDFSRILKNFEKFCNEIDKINLKMFTRTWWLPGRSFNLLCSAKKFSKRSRSSNNSHENSIPQPNKTIIRTRTWTNKSLQKTVRIAIPILFASDHYKMTNL